MVFCRWYSLLISWIAIGSPFLFCGLETGRTRLGVRPALLSAQVFAVGGDHFLVPIEGVLPLPAQIAGAVVKFVDVDKTVPLGHFSGRGADQINAAPG